MQMPIPDNVGTLTLPYVARQETDALDESEKRIMRDVESLEAQAKRLRQIVDNIRAAKRMRGLGAEIPGVKRDEYKGMRATDALEVYLRSRRDMRISLAQAVADLITGGVDPGQPRGRQNDPTALLAHTLKIALQNRAATFQWEPAGLLKGIPDDKIMLSLAETADQPRRRKRDRAG